MVLCAFLIEPSLYIIDEPFLSLDPLAIHALLELMDTMRKQGAAILMSTHILATAENIVIVLWCYTKEITGKRYNG